MPIPRLVEPEQLDALPTGDPMAIQSRNDLRRLNRVMGQAGSVARLLRSHAAGRPLRRLVDLGGGDGTLLLRVARSLAPHHPGVHAVVVDRQMLMSPATGEGFGRLGWEVETATADVLEWISRAEPREGTVMIANLFLHHLQDAALRALLAAIAARADGFVACEPRRDRLTLTASRLVGWIGCNAVTRHDAPVSVRAGFRGRELSALWPAGDAWTTEEGATGLFSHSFMAWTRGTRAPR